MDVSFLDSRVARDITESPRASASPGQQDTRSQESFADHLQTEPPLATHDSAHDETQPVDVEDVPADQLAGTEDQGPEPVDETGARSDAVAASAQPTLSTQLQPIPVRQSRPAIAEQPQPVTTAQAPSVITEQPQPVTTAQAQPASAAQLQPVTADGTQVAAAAQLQPATADGTPQAPAEQPQPARVADPQLPHTTQPSTVAPVDVLPTASSGVEAVKAEKSAAPTDTAPGVAQQQVGHPASAVTAVSGSAAAKRQATTATLRQFESATGTVPGTGGLSTANDPAVVDQAAGSAEKPAGKTSAEKTGVKSQTTGASGQSGESPTLAAAKPDSVVQTLAELNPANRAIDALAAELPVGAERADTSPATTGKEAEAKADTNGRVLTLTERLPDQLFGRSSSGVHASQEITQPDQLRLVERVARAIEAAPQRGGLLRLRLRPPELGAVRLEVLLERGNLTARIETESQQARNVLLEHLPQLRERLTAQGIHVEQFDVEVSSRDSSETPFQSHDSEDSLPSSLARRREAAVSESSAEIHRAPDLSFYSSPGKLNVVI